MVKPVLLFFKLVSCRFLFCCLVTLGIKVEQLHYVLLDIPQVMVLHLDAQESCDILCSFLPVNNDKSSVVCGFDSRNFTCTITAIFSLSLFCIAIMIHMKRVWDRLKFSPSMSILVNKKGLCISNWSENWENMDYGHTANCLTKTEWLHPQCLLGTFPGPWCPPNYGWALSGRVPKPRQESSECQRMWMIICQVLQSIPWPCLIF